MRKAIFLLLAVLAVFSCREPHSTEQFVPGEGPFVFSVDLSDTTAVYDVDLYSRLDAVSYPSQVQMLARWASPSDSVYRETFWMPLSPEVYTPYRAGLRAFEPGIWTLTLTSPSLPEGFRGLGLVVKKRQVWDTEN